MSDTADGAGSGEDPGPRAADPLGADAPTGLDAAAEADAAAAQVVDDLSALEREFDQTTEDAVAEAVGLAQQFEAERNELRDLAQRVQADFENYKRRVAAQQTEQRERAAEDLVRELLPVLDTCDAAIGQGQEHVGPVRDQLLLTLTKLGLAEVADAEVAFDPNVHEAVMHDEGDGDTGPIVVEVLRTGYLWHERVVRPAMVRVRG